MEQENSPENFGKIQSFIEKPSPTQVTLKIKELFSYQDYQTSCKCILILDNVINNHLF